METKILLIYFLIMISIGGCTVTPAPTQEIITPTPAATETKTVVSRSATPTFTKSPTSHTATFTQEWAPSETVTPAYTPTVNYLKYINQKCVEAKEYWKVKEDFAGISGKLFLNVMYSPYDYILEFADYLDEYNFIPKKGYKYISDYTASPDLNWFAYSAVANPDTDHEKSVLVVQSSDSKTVKEFPHDINEWTSISRWLNNQWIGLVKYNNGQFEKITHFNPFTGEKKVMPTDYPDLAEYSLSGIFYDPTLSRVIYHSHDKDGDYFIYRDLKNERTIFKYPVTDGVITPRWSPDGKSFVFVKGSPGVGERNELIRSDWDGNLSQLTDLSSYFASAMIYSVVWSPNSRYIALMVDVSFSSTQDPNTYVTKLFVIDVESKKVTEYCIPINDIWATIVWSPDSRYLATSSGNKDCYCSSAIVVDVETGEKAVMAAGIQPVMWIK